jgi:hypothetical protein
VCREVSLLVNKKSRRKSYEIPKVLWRRYSPSFIIHVNTFHDPESNRELPERNETYPTLEPRGWMGGQSRREQTSRSQKETAILL